MGFGRRREGLGCRKGRGLGGRKGRGLGGREEGLVDRIVEGAAKSGGLGDRNGRLRLQKEGGLADRKKALASGNAGAFTILLLNIYEILLNNYFIRKRHPPKIEHPKKT